MATRRRAAEHSLRLRPRMYRDAEIALGPGKIALLAAIADTGSIRLAAENMGMSYMRAWTLVRTMNGCFKRPLVQALRGGRDGGRAQLTPEGQEILKFYRQLATASHGASQPYWRKFERQMK